MFYRILNTANGAELWRADPQTREPQEPLKACRDRREALHLMRRLLRRSRNLNRNQGTRT